MILYPYHALAVAGSLDAWRSLEGGGHGLAISIRHDCLLRDLKNCIITYLHGQHSLGKDRYCKVYESLRLWYFHPHSTQWKSLTAPQDWDLVKLLASRTDKALQLMYDDGHWGGSTLHKDASRVSSQLSLYHGQSTPPPAPPPKLSLLDMCQDTADSNASPTLLKQVAMAERLEQKLLLSRRL